MAEEKQEVEIVKVPMDGEKFNPHEVIMNNAQLLIYATPQNKLEIMEAQLSLLLQQLAELKGKKTDNDISKDAGRLMAWIVALSSIQLAIEYWMKNLKKSQIKVYSPQDMPKS